MPLEILKLNSRKRLYLGIFLFLAFFTTVPTSASTYKISLLTCDPGDELYSTFGHSAIRVVELESGQDLVFNYGTFDFNTPFFYIKFIRRTLDYQLSLTTTANFLREYNYFKRNVREQELNLSPEQSQAIVAFLQNNYRPENRKYRYDFFFDNCATRITDMLESVLGQSLKWNYPTESDEKTFRNLIDEYVYPLPWSDLGIDLALGAVIDREATEAEKAFLPDYLEASFGRATIIGDGPERPLVSRTNTIYDFPEPVGNKVNLFNPYVVFWVLAILVGILTFIGFKKKRLFKGFDISLFTILGLLGVLLVFLWFFTAHSQTKNNWNLFWSFPGHLYISYLLIKNPNKAILKKLLLAAMILADLALVIWLLGFQSFHPSILPILLIVILRTNFLYYNLDRFNYISKRN
jgi:heme/copper-type cytochrome/quinol oxidase subunit 4